MKFRLAFVLMLIAFASAAQVPLPKWTLVPETADSHPFLGIKHVLTPIDLDKAGYIEEEYLISGKANVYDWNADSSLTVKTPNAPYTTRILVRRPKDPARFSGTVVAEMMNTGRGYDWAIVWGYANAHFMERGHAWVGITHNLRGAAALRKFNPARYGSVSYANPNPSETCGPNNATHDADDGVRWDAISQIGAALHATNGPLGNLTAQRVLLTGHTAGELPGYVSAILRTARQANGKLAYDGVLVKAGNVPNRIRDCAPAIAQTDPRAVIRNVGVPVIYFQAEGDVVATQFARRDDSDTPGDEYRHYEIAGGSHIDRWAYRYLPVPADQKAVGSPIATVDWPFNYRCEPEIQLSSLKVMTNLLDGAFANLERWVKDGAPAPKAPRVELANGAIARDAFNNAKGGVRSPQLDVPVATYKAKSLGEAACANLGSQTPLSWPRLEATYGNANGYATKVKTSIAQSVKDSWITPTDAKSLEAELLAQ